MFILKNVLNASNTPDIYNIHNSNFNKTPHVKSLIPRTSPGIQKSIKAFPPKPGYNGPAYLAKHIYDMLSDDVKKALDKYNKEMKAQYKPTHPRMAKVHEQDHDEANHPNNPEPELENHLPDDSYPMQDLDIEDLLETHGLCSAKMASTYHISKHSVSSYGSLVDRSANGGLAGADVCVLERPSRKVSVTGIDDHELPGLDIFTSVALIQTSMAKLTCSCMNMPIMAGIILFTLLVRWSGSTIHVMTNLIMLEVNKSSHSWMDM